MKIDIFRNMYKIVLTLAILAFTQAGIGENALENGDFSQDLKGWVNAKQHDFEASVKQNNESPSGRFLSIVVKDSPKKAWHIQMRHPAIGSVQTDQEVELTAWMRSPESVSASVSLQLAKSPFTGLTFKRVKLTPEWKKYDFGQLTRAAASKLQVTITAGFDVGEVQVADVKLRLGEVKQTPAVPASELEPISLDGIDFPGLADALGADPRSIVKPMHKLRIYNDAGDIANSQHTSAIQISTSKQTEWTYQVQAIAPTLTPIKQGDTLLALARWRCVQENELIGYASLGLIFELAGPPNNKDLSMLYTASGSEWNFVAVPFQASRDYSPGKASFNLRVGYGPQVIDVSHFALVNLGPGVDLDQVPRTTASYGGSEPDAPWRAEAEQRIQQHRTGLLNVKVVDGSGDPLPNADVHVQMKRHHFGFGSAISANRLPGGRKASDAGPYLEKVSEIFNWVVFENAMKWRAAELPYYQRQVDTGLSWMQENNMTVRGHTMVWPGYRRSPKDLPELASEPEKLRERIDTHITEIAKRYAGTVKAWDVINEPYKNRDLQNILGEDEIRHWLEVARKADPEALMFINDFHILSDPSSEPVRAKFYLELIDKLQGESAPLDGIGMQSHFSGELTPIEQIIARLDRFADKGMRIHITEFDIATDDEELQAAYTRDFLTACFSHPHVECVVMWGFWEGEMFQPKGALYRKDWTLKPNGQVWKELTRTTWWTDQNIATDSQGQAQLRGYLGDYEISVSLDGKATQQSVSLNREGATVVLRLE